MLEVLAIDHIVLRTTKLDEMLEFYTKVLGCTVERETRKKLDLPNLERVTH